MQALDIVKQAKVAQILGSGGSGDGKRSVRGSRLGSRESLESMQYEGGDDVSIIFAFNFYLNKYYLIPNLSELYYISFCMYCYCVTYCVRLRKAILFYLSSILS